MDGDRHGFPLSLTSYVDRVTDTARVAALLGERRLVTVTGPGGVGKTRLASEVARRVSGRFADGVWLVELAQMTDMALIAPTVATALAVADDLAVLATSREPIGVAGETRYRLRPLPVAAADGPDHGYAISALPSP